jgi:hypothetical protein
MYAETYQLLHIFNGVIIRRMSAVEADGCQVSRPLRVLAALSAFQQRPHVPLFENCVIDLYIYY